MEKHKQNAKWLMYFVPFKSLSISAAYLTPFFLQNGLSLSEIFLLQSIFSITIVLWEIPSGYLADKFGRASVIKLSAPIAATAMITYGFCHLYWQFMICEIILGLANGLISGADEALLYDSLKVEGEEKKFTSIKRRMKSLEFLSVAVSIPISFALVRFVNIESTIVVDGLLCLFGSFVITNLVEAPHYERVGGSEKQSVFKTLKALFRKGEVAWLVTLGAILNVSTLIGFWIAPVYYEKIGISAVYFGAILAARSLFKSWISMRFAEFHNLERKMYAFGILAGLSYIAMSTEYAWFALLLIGHDIVQALASQPISQKINEHIDRDLRATMNSAVFLIYRLTFTVFGPLVGLAIDKVGMPVSLAITGAFCSTVALTAVFKLHKYKTFY